MSTLVLVLITAMVVPGNGPEMVSAEMEQGLDIRGEWKGMYYTASGISYEVRVNSDGVYNPSKTVVIFSWIITDEGAGRLRFGGAEYPCLGIYQQDGERLAICYRSRHLGRPESLMGGNGQALLILRRVKPRK